MGLLRVLVVVFLLVFSAGFCQQLLLLVMSESVLDPNQIVIGILDTETNTMNITLKIKTVNFCFLFFFF